MFTPIINYVNVYHNDEVVIKFKCSMDQVCRQRLFTVNFINTVNNPIKRPSYN